MALFIVGFLLGALVASVVIVLISGALLARVIGPQAAAFNRLTGGS